MTPEITAIGGARVGWFYATWPFARLSATRSRLSLSLGPFGSFEFGPQDVVRLERYGSILNRGIRIVHVNPRYPEEIAFGCIGPDSLIRDISMLGFRPSAAPAQIVRREGGPFRWSFLIGVLVVWNGLILLDLGSTPWKEQHKLGIYSFIAIALLFLTALGLTRSPWLRALAFKPGRSASEALPTIRFAQLAGFVGVAAMVIQSVLR